MHRMTLKRWLVILWLCGALILAAQPIRGWLDAQYQGLLPYNGGEEAMYMIRTQEALLHPELVDVSNGIWSGSEAPAGLQNAGMERVIGWLFFWTGMSAPLLVTLLTLLIAPLIMPVSALIARRGGMRAPHAIVLSVVFFVGIAFARRHFHPGFSLPLVLSTLLMLWAWWDTPKIARACVAGALMGASVSVYLWSWTFLFTVAGLMTIAACIWKKKGRLQTAGLLWLVAIIVAAPAVLGMLSNADNAHYLAASIRAGLVHSRALESPVRSTIAVVLALLVWIGIPRADRSRYVPLLAIVSALAIVHVQQIIHGVVISFISHYEHYLFFGALLAAGIAWSEQMKMPLRIGIIGIAGVLTLAAWVDHPTRLHAFAVPDQRHQFLAPALTALGDGHELVLSDRVTSDFVAMYTLHDVAFTEYTEFLLISDQEYRERYCLSELFTPEPLDIEVLTPVDEERLRVLRGQTDRRDYAKNLQVFRQTCKRVRENAVETLQRYGVTMLLWNERWRPESRPDETLFSLLQQGEDWSMWRFIGAQTGEISPETSR